MIKTDRMELKLRYQAPKLQRINRFNYVTIEGCFGYCHSHMFVYNKEQEEAKLHRGEPCFYTDRRFEESYFNLHGKCYLHFSRTRSKKFISKKSAFRLIERCRNIPKGTIVKIESDYVGPYSYLYKVKKDNILDIKYEVSKDSFLRDFTDVNNKMQKLVDTLRGGGFLVQVFNTNIGTICGEYEGEIAIAYGHGKRVGFSTEANPFRGYIDGCENILWGDYLSFDKWSNSNKIDKGREIVDIVSELIN